jgi:hypothetical protein
LTASRWDDAKNYFRERNKKYPTAGLKVPAIANLNDISTALETAEFVDDLDQPSTAEKIPSYSRCYLRLGSTKMLPDHDIDCILPIN